MRKFSTHLKTFLAVMLLLVGSNCVEAAPSYFRVEIIPVLDEGAAGVVFACDNASANNKYYNYYSNIGKDGLWTTHFDATIERLSGGNPNFYIMAQPGNQKTMFDGWYWDAACTERLGNSSSGINTYAKVTVNGNGRSLTSYSSAAAAEAGTKIIIYAKFVKITPDFDWSAMAATPADDGKYYIYSPATHRFLKAPQGTASSSNKPVSTDNPAEATLFTCDKTGTGTKNTFYDNYGVKEDRSYSICSFAYNNNGTTTYLRADSYSWSTSKTNIYVWSWASLSENTFYLTKADATGSDFTYGLEIYLNGELDYPAPTALKKNGGVYWMFIPESAFFDVAEVSDVNENGSATITSAPTGTGTAYVKFNVSAGSIPAAFNYELSGADKSYWALGTTTCADGVLTVPVTYTAQNRHSGTSTSASTVTVTVTANNAGATTASGIASAYTDFEPRFALNVNTLDWSRVGEEVVETFYVGQEIAASERDRLANKLVKNDAQTTGVAANNATWTATITGTNADQFKFANGTRTVEGLYSANLLDVIYAPTTTGNHEATLHIVTSYTDANSHTETYERDITLRGVGSAASRITFAKAGNQLPTNAETHNFGEIIGTNQQDITADLFISQITNPQMVWDDPAGQFVFINQSSVDLSQLNQTLTFRAKRTSPVTANTNHTATLTISGKGTANEDVSATITLTYTALPLIQTMVTWNWATIKENSTVSTPITTNSDGVWTLEKSAGEKITYNNEEKTATAAYLHHEPGVTAEFVLNIPQTDTYTAFGAEYETSILPLSAHIYVTRQDQLGDSKAGTEGIYGKVSKWASTWETWDDATKTLQVRGDNIWFYFSGQTKFAFDFVADGANSWTITDLDKNGGTIRKLTAQAFTAGHNVYSPSPQTATLQMNGRGKLSNINFYEYDTIAADKEQVALIYDNGSISTLDVSTTFANKRQVTVSLNATAAQYFQISTTGKSIGSSMVFDSNDGLGLGTEVSKVFTVAMKVGANVAEAKAATAGNACQLIFADDYTYNHEVLSLPIMVIEPCEITYKHSANGSYTVTYQNDDVAHEVSGADYNKSVTTAEPADYVVTLSAPSPASGYQFQGWKVGSNVVSRKQTFTTSIGIDGCIVEAVFVPVEAQNFKVGDVYFADLGAALSAANASADSKVVTLMQDVTLETGSYTVPAGVTLLIPHKADFFELQETPEIVVRTQEVLSAYRTLTLKPGVTISCDGNICVSGKMLSDGGGNKSAYTTGECGVINMVHGGHIELNNGAHLFCWGYIKGQDMDQGNNTQGTGTVTANSGATIWENFELGDWRGGSASLDIYNNNVIDHRKLFPFQSYAIQNIEIPTTFKYGSTLRNYTSITTGYGNHGAVFSMIGPAETMFLLTDEQSVVRTWYDPTTDLSCYELSGTAQLDAIHITVYVSMSSEDFILPISNNMHIILKDCNMTLANPLMVQAGSIIEIKPTANVNLTSELYLYDVDQWGKYVHNYYFRSFNNITSHKNRGAEDSKDGLDDAKLIVDGIFNVNNGGKIYSTAGGANIMGNHGGVINFNTTLPTEDILWAVKVKSELPYIEWEYNNIYAANLCNEDGSYTRSIGSGNAFYNVNGRWFHSEDKDPDPEDHTYFFTYMDGGNMGTEDASTAAVYSHDKTGLEARMKWFNVEEDENCPNWWTGTGPAASYNYTMLNAWHQFIETETPKVYSGSDNALYQKEGCSWVETGAVDENCLYTFVDGKKALVDGQFIPLTSNGYDPAYHATANAEQYYICFSGCNWHPATPYVGESKAYTIRPEAEDLHYIWFENDWMNVQRDEPFFYTADEVTNVRTYYEYVNGDWVVATPYVSVSDDAETRTFYMIKEAFNVASIKKDATITLLRDLPNVAEVLTYTTQNTTCTLDLNGHILGGTVANLVTVNAPGATFTITDNAALKIGKISTTQSKAVYAQKGTVVLSNGTLEATGAYAIECASAGSITINGGYLAASTKCVNVAGSCTISGGHFTTNTGLANYCAANKYPFETSDSKYRYEVSDAYTITFKNGETILQTLHLKPGETPAYTAAQPTKDGYKFTGWSPAIVAAAADAIYQAQFAAKAAEERCVTLNSNGGNEGLQYVYVTTDAAIGTVPAGTTKEGHTFAGWFTAANGGTQITNATVVSADVTWYAHYTKNTYTLTWDANGGDLSGSYTSGSVEFGAAITAPTATMTGHTFLGWDATPASKMPAQDVTYTAQWSIRAKHYLQNLDGTYPAAPEATDNVTGGAGEYVTPAVKTFDGFITPATQTVRIGETTEVTYNYERRTYTITLNANGGTCATASVNVKHGATPNLPAATKAGRSFDGWFTKAVGGDRITNETVIQRNIGTLYAQFVDNNLIVSAPMTITDTRSVADLRVTATGKLTITGDVTADNFILESNGSTASGQFLDGHENMHFTNAYFDLTLNAQKRTWYGVGVPWRVNAQYGIYGGPDSEHLTLLRLGKDFDIIWYNGETRAAAGPVNSCYEYLEDIGDPNNRIVEPGRMYFMFFASPYNVIRFKKLAGEPLVYVSYGDVARYSSELTDETNHNWNGIANSYLTHVTTLDAVKYAYRYKSVNIDQNKTSASQWELVTNFAGSNYVVGQAVMVQVPQSGSGEVWSVPSSGSAPLRRMTAESDIDRAEVLLTSATGVTDRILCVADDNAEDKYTLGDDLVKFATSNDIPQMWIRNYNHALAVNAVRPEDNTATYPLTILSPKADDYKLSLVNQMEDGVRLYLTFNGEAVADLTEGEYTIRLGKETSKAYALRLVRGPRGTVTGVDEAIEGKENVQKVVMDGVLYIIRQGKVYDASGRLVK